eukprot:PhM_4_TR13679/c0_g1_i2/m.19475
MSSSHCSTCEERQLQQLQQLQQGEKESADDETCDTTTTEPTESSCVDHDTSCSTCASRHAVRHQQQQQFMWWKPTDQRYPNNFVFLQSDDDDSENQNDEDENDSTSVGEGRVMTRQMSPIRHTEATAPTPVLLQITKSLLIPPPPTEQKQQQYEEINHNNNNNNNFYASPSFTSTTSSSSTSLSRFLRESKKKMIDVDGVAPLRDLREQQAAITKKEENNDLVSLPLNETKIQQPTVDVMTSTTELNQKTLLLSGATQTDDDVTVETICKSEASAQCVIVTDVCETKPPPTLSTTQASTIFWCHSSYYSSFHCTKATSTSDDDDVWPRVTRSSAQTDTDYDFETLTEKSLRQTVVWLGTKVSALLEMCHNLLHGGGENDEENNVRGYLLEGHEMVVDMLSECCASEALLIEERAQLQHLVLESKLSGFFELETAMRCKIESACFEIEHLGIHRPLMVWLHKKMVSQESALQEAEVRMDCILGDAMSMRALAQQERDHGRHHHHEHHQLHRIAKLPNFESIENLFHRVHTECWQLACAEKDQ